jgi:hypothetical protein
MRKLTVLAMSILLAACASQAITPAPAAASGSKSDSIEFPASVAQGGLVLGHVPPGSSVDLRDRPSVPD